MNNFLAVGWIKHTEEDSHATGLIGGGFATGGHESFTGATVDALIKQCADFAGTENLKDCLLDSCDEAGRLDIQVYECEDGSVATDYEIHRWREGEKRLWLSTYTFQLLRAEKIVISRNVSNKDIYTVG